MERFKVKTEIVFGEKPAHIVYTPDDIRINKIVQTHTFDAPENCRVIAIVLGANNDNDVYVKDEKTVVIYGREYRVEHAEYTSCGSCGRVKSNIKIKALAEVVL